MPTSPTLAERLADATVELYLDAERTLLTRIADAIAAGIDAPGWAERQLLEVQRYRTQAQALLVQVEAAAGQSIAEAVLTGYNRGNAAAAAELARLLDLATGATVAALPGSRGVAQLVRETIGLVSATTPRILRATTDVYRDVIAQTTGRVLTGVQTRREVAQTALDRFATRGVVGFVDQAGRGWDMASYVEMATRTAAAHAAVDGHTDRLHAAGIDLVIVSDAPQECRMCRPWEGKVLSLSGAVRGAVEVESATSDRMVSVHVAGTLGQARAAGLYHPGCRHSHSAYLPGATRIPTDTEDPQGDADRQRLRYLERQVRAWKRREAVALDDTAAKAARVKVRGYQARIREHVATTTAKRQPTRERIGAAR